MLQKKYGLSLVILMTLVLGMPGHAISAGLFTKIKDNAIMKWAG